MQYRKLSHLDFEVSAAGCGAMRLPTRTGNDAAIDKIEATRKLDAKRPSWKVESPQDFDKYIKEQLAKLQTDSVDFYLPYANSGWWCKLRDLGVLNLAEKAIGGIDHLALSFYDGYEILKEIVGGYGKRVMYLNTVDK
jgi:uncharacterized protein